MLLLLFTFKVLRALIAASRAGIASASSDSHSDFRVWAAVAFSLADASSFTTISFLAATSMDSCNTNMYINLQ